MKFKDLFEVKKISRIIIIVLVIFLLLPVISPEETDVKPIKKENSFTHEDSPLPIFPKENLLEKYVNKLKKFYKMDVPVFTQQEETLTQNETQTIHQIQEKEKSKEDVNITAGDLFFSADYDGEDFSGLDSSPRQEDKTVNLQKGTVLTKDGNLLHPTQEGYYYAEKFYKNGTYPQNKDRKHIEGALNRYHSRVARTLGKKAVYFADDRGNLTVSYVDELPNEIAADIDTYLAQNQIKTPKRNLAVKQNKNTDKYQGATINTQNNNNPDTSDIALASIRDMHAAYNLVKEKIQSGAIGAGIVPNNPNNLIPMGNILLNQTAIAQQPPENPEDEIFCQGNECDNSLKIAPIVLENEFGDPDSDLHNFYSSFCEDTCPYSRAYFDDTLADKPIDLDFQKEEDINKLKEAIENSDKKIIEIAYIHPNEEYMDLLNYLRNISLTNKNGEPVEIRLRGLEKVDNNASFGDKMAGPFKNNINKDLTSAENDVSYNTIVERYNQVHENVQDNINQNKHLQYYKEFFPNLNFDPPVAFVERSEEGDFFTINNSYIPKGYITEIPQWEKYKTNDESGSYYKVSKNILFNPPSDLVIIAVQDGKKRSITLQDGHPIGIISKEILQNLNFNNVKSTKTEIANTQIETIIYNAEKLENETNKKQ